MSSPVLFGAMVGIFVLLLFVAIWRSAGRRDPVEERLRKFGVSENDLTSVDALPGAARRLPWSGTNRRLATMGLGVRLANALTQADWPLTAAEFVLIVIACFLAGAVLGTYRLGMAFGGLLGLLLAWLPIMILNRQRRRRQQAFTNQIPEILTLLVGALRAGFGISQAMGVIVNQLAPPASLEFSRALRAMALGLPLQRALTDLALRVGTDEITMMVTAITVQHETGGNLAQTLDTIGDTVRDRLRIKGEIRALTASQRLTGYLLAGLPIVLAVILWFIRPNYILALIAPGLMRVMLGIVLLMQIMGFLWISRIVDIEV
jgi:tight adherence protein B